MGVKTIKKRKTKPLSAVRKPARRKREDAERTFDLEALLARIENDPTLSATIKEIAALRRQRDESGEPYLSIEQVLAEVGRD